MDKATELPTGAKPQGMPIFPLTPEEVRALLRMGIIPPRQNSASRI